MADKTTTQTRRTSAKPKQSPRKPAKEPTGGVRRELLSAEVLDKAAVLFGSQGFAATTLQDVADAVGLSRSSIYYYYPSKDALLAELIQGVTLPVAKIFRTVEDLALPPQQKIQEIVRRLVLWVADPRTHFRLMDRSEAELPTAISKVHRDAKRRVLDEMVKLIDTTVIAGEARVIDSRVTALSIIGMAMWTAWWFRPGHGQPLEEVAQIVAEHATAILKPPRPGGRPSTIAVLTREMRENLALLEKMATGPVAKG